MSKLYRMGLKRVLDLLLATVAGLLLLPIVLLVLLVPGVRIVRKRRLGRNGNAFTEYRLRCPTTGLGRLLERISFHRLPALWNIAMGQMAFVGPRALRTSDPLPREGLSHIRFSVRPGYVSPWWLRLRSNMTFDDESMVDAEYVVKMSLGHDVGIVLRSLLASLYGRSGDTISEATLHLLGVSIRNTTTEEAIDGIMCTIEGGQRQRIYFVNADSLNKAFENDAFRSVLNETDHVLGDGIGIKLGARMTHQHIRENVNGTDLFPRLCERLGKGNKRLYLLGAKPGIADRAGNWVREQHPRVVIAGTRDGYFQQDETDQVVDDIRTSHADVLLVAFGAPRQETWISEHFDELGVPIAIGVGGLFDFYSGNVPRAPIWMREVGLEWMYRLIREPQRMCRRYLIGNVLFVLRVLRTRGKTALSLTHGKAAKT